MTWMSKANPGHASDVAHFVVGDVPACSGQKGWQWVERGDASPDVDLRAWAPLRPQDHLCTVCRSTHRMICMCPKCAPLNADLGERSVLYDRAVAKFGDAAAVVRWGDACIVGRWVRTAALHAEGLVMRSPDRGSAVEVLGKGATWGEAAVAAGLAPAPSKRTNGGEG